MPDSMQEAVAATLATLDASNATELDPSALPAPDTSVQKTMIGVEIRRTPGKAPVLVIDCREFHAHLVRLGVQVHQNGGQREFENLPGRRVNVQNNAVTPYALLSYVDLQPRQINLAEHYTGSATFQQLMDLAYSVDRVSREIVEHYRPVEIKLRLVDKKG